MKQCKKFTNDSKIINSSAKIIGKTSNVCTNNCTSINIGGHSKSTRNRIDYTI